MTIPAAASSGLPQDFWDALNLLGRAGDRYRDATGGRVVIVGGAAVSFYTQGLILSGDFDLVADLGFEAAMLAEGFRKEDRPGWLLREYYHPDLPRYGFELVSGPLFDGKTDGNRLLPVHLKGGSEVLFAPIEDLIADRLGQYAASDEKDIDMLRQAQSLFRLALECDRDYLRRRIIEESGDPAAVGLV